MRRALLAIASLCLACGSQATRYAPTAPAEQDPRAERLQSRRIQELAAAVEDVTQHADGPGHASIVAALSRLGRVVREMDVDAGSKIEELTTELMRSPSDEVVHADVVIKVLSTALDAFAVRLREQAPPGARDAYVIARDTTARVSGDAPLSDEVLEVAGALRALTNLAAVTEGAPPPFAVAVQDVRIGYDAVTLQERAQQANIAVAELANERDWKRAGQRAADALDAFAGVLAVAPLELPAQQWRSLVLAVRFEALELSRRGAVSLDRSAHVKTGLLPCVEALNRIQARRRVGTLATFIKTATAAIDRIDPSVVFVFQRAAVQEAFRSVADGFLLVAGSSEVSLVPTSVAR